MNEGTTKLLEQLAQKLGTTSEYLWGILLKQAPISATMNTLGFIIILLIGIVLYKLHNSFMINENKTSYYNLGDNLGIPMFIVSIFWFGMVIFVFAKLPYILNGFFNPEFWAFNYILDSLSNN